MELHLIHEKIYLTIKEYKNKFAEPSFNKNINVMNEKFKEPK